MRLEQIVLHGFKSFADRTEVAILPGITCVVGPNGCGKSNVADAVRWALGEQSPKILRGQRMEDVIFHGSASRRPVGMAEVALIFSNDETLAVPWSEVGVARRLYRTGDSEYLLNGNVCRLRDIHDLFAGTGVNPKAYALMDQERLNHVLTAKPWERRVFIEEAAGIARYKQQRHETQGKLEAARQNLARVRDVMDEVRRQVASLERQARRARQYKALHQERQALALAMLAADFAQLGARQAGLAAERAELRGREERLQFRLDQIEARVGLARSAIQESDWQLADLRQAVHKADLEVQGLVHRREQLAGQLAELGEEDLRLAEEIAQKDERARALVAERADKAEALEAARAEQEREAARLVRLEAEVAEMRQRREQRQTEAEALRLRQAAAAGRRAELGREEAELGERAAQLARVLERLQAERGAARDEAEELERRRHQLEEGRRRTGVQLSLLSTERQEVQGLLAEREALRSHLQGSLAEARLALAARQSSLAALTQLERDREGYGAGVRTVFAARESQDLPGLVGTVADLLEVPAGLEAAVEGVLGDRLQWIVVERFEHARAALGYLARAGGGAATFLPLETLPAPGAPPGASPPLRWAAEVVGGPHPALLHYLLGRVAIVPHLDEAEALWRRNGVVATYVTPAGEVLSPIGRLAGGRRDGEREDQDHGILRRKRAIRQLGDEVAALGREVELQQGLLDGLEADLAGLRRREQALQASVQEQETVRVAGDKELEAAVREIDRVRKHLETLAFEHERAERDRAQAQARLDAVAAELAGLVESQGRLDETASALRAELEERRAAEATLAEAVTTCRLTVAGAAGRAEALAGDLGRLAELMAETEGRVAECRRRRLQIAERRTETAREQAAADRAAQEAAERRRRLEEAVTAEAERREARADELRGLEDEQRAAEQERQGAVAAIHRVELAATEARVRQDELLQEARRAHGLDGPAALEAAHDPGRDRAGLAARHEELTAKLEGMGPVNLVADDEYREAEERLGFLRAQHDDLTASIKDLERALRGMTQTAQQRFAEAFEAINRHFGEIFARLFEGGRAELRMVEPEEGADDDPLEQGVELMAQPRGKRLQSVTLMSGGEKALTGLALLFAVFYYRPSPFCVLDEVDAPLDDANIHRFLRVLRELTSQTQFVVITHNRKTMEAADVLYGVTMEEPGLSRLVSVKL
jgi:chromosome segregation protein